MLLFKVEIYTGFGVETYKWLVVANYEHEAIDVLIDWLMENEENNHLFDSEEQLDDDMVLIGGNCSDRLITYGMFNFEVVGQADDDTPDVKVI